MYSMSQPIFFRFQLTQTTMIPGPFERRIETCGWAPSVPSLRVDTGCVTVGAAAGGANYKAHPKMPKNAVKMMTNQWNVANLHNQMVFPSQKRSPPPQLRCRGDRFFPLSVPDGARRGDGARLFRTAPLRAKQSSQKRGQRRKVHRSQLSFLPAFLPDQHLPAEMVEITK